MMHTYLYKVEYNHMRTRLYSQIPLILNSGVARISDWWGPEKTGMGGGGGGWCGGGGGGVRVMAIDVITAACTLQFNLHSST